MHLKSGTYLQGDKYRIISVLGQGGFGITYLAEHELASRNVCIKEFFPKEYYNRDTDSLNASLGSLGSADAMERFKEKFIKEAKTIARLDHPNIIHIHDVFKENNTCYYVMDYIDGESLQSLVKHSGALAESVAKAYMREACAAIEHIHSMRINHLDIKPGNIMVRKSDNRVVVIDFGLAKQYDTDGNQTSSTPVGISHGYAPMEQYKQGGVSEFAPATDVYSLGATLYYLVTGVVPPPAADVAEDGLPELPAHLSEGVKRAIEGAMQSRRKDRAQSVAEFVKLLDCDSAATTTVPPVAAAPIVEPQVELSSADEATELGVVAAPKEAPQPKNEWTPKYATDNKESNTNSDNKGGRKRLWRWLVGIALVVVAALAVFYFIGGNGSNEETVVEMTMEERIKASCEQLYDAAVQGDVDKFRDIYDDFSKLTNEAELKGCLTECEQAAMEWIEQNSDKAGRISEFYEGIYSEPEIEKKAECGEEMICYDEWAAEECCEEADCGEWAEDCEAVDEYDYYECAEECVADE